MLPVDLANAHRANGKSHQKWLEESKSTDQVKPVEEAVFILAHGVDNSHHE